MSLLRSLSAPLPKGCYCNPGKCMAPVIMGKQMPCRDPEKAAREITPAADQIGAPLSPKKEEEAI